MKKFIMCLFLLGSLSSWASHKASCISAAKDAGMGSNFVSKVCEKANKHTAACVSAAKRTGMGSAYVAAACSEATSHSPSCVAISRSTGMGSNFTADVCQNANLETLNCIKVAREKGMGSEFVVETCKNNEYVSPNSSQYDSALDRDRLKIMLIDALANIDANPERAKANIQNILLEIELNE